jgi:hypothetical protein
MLTSLLSAPRLSTMGLICAGGVLHCAAAAEWTVDPTGNDQGVGSSDAPLRTIQQAAHRAQAGDRVIIRTGVYRESVRPARSGTTDLPITFSGAPGATVVVSGAEVVNDWKHDGDGIWSAPLPSAVYRSDFNFSMQVYVNGEEAHLARWPDWGPERSVPAKGVCTRFLSRTVDEKTHWVTGQMEATALAERPADWALGAHIFFQPSHEAWAYAFTGEITAHAGSTFTFRTRGTTGQSEGGDGRSRYHDRSRFVLSGTRTLLDAPGEWWHDRTAGRLLLIPPTGVDPTRAVIEAKRRDLAFDLDGLSFIAITDLAVVAATITTDRNAGGDGHGVDSDGKIRYPWRGRDSVAPSSGVRLERLHIRYPTHMTDHSGHWMAQWAQATGIILSGSDHLMRNCIVRDATGNGITVIGQRNQVLDNLILDVATGGTDCAAIHTGAAAYSRDHEIGHNTIRGTGRNGIQARYLANSLPWRQKARIHHNDISRTMLQDWDGGGIYLAVDDARFLRIDHNWIHDIAGYTSSGIYPDFVRNLIIERNVVWNVEWPIHLEGEHPENGASHAANNTLVAWNTLLAANTSNAGYGPFALAGNGGRNHGTLAINNLIGCLTPAAGARGWKITGPGFAHAELLNNFIGNPGDPLIRNLTERDFRPQPEALKPSQPVPPFVRDGVTITLASAPMCGAYHPEEPLWRAGSQLVEVPFPTVPIIPAGAQNP